MTCTYWCSDVSASFFHTTFTNSHGQKGGVAFGENVMKSMTKGASVSAYDKFSPFLVPW